MPDIPTKPEHVDFVWWAPLNYRFHKCHDCGEELDFFDSFYRREFGGVAGIVCTQVGCTDCFSSKSGFAEFLNHYNCTTTVEGYTRW